MSCRKCGFFIIIFSFLILGVCYGAFNITRANTQFEIINEKLTQALSPQQLHTEIGNLTQLQGAVTDCLDQNKNEIKKIENFKKNMVGAVKPNMVNQHILKTKAKFEKNLTQCQLLYLQIADKLENAKKTLTKRRLIQLKEQGLPLWKMSLHGKFQNALQNIDLMALGVGLFSLLLIAVLGIYLKKIILLFLSHAAKNKNIITILFLNLKFYFIPLVFFGFNAFFFYIYPSNLKAIFFINYIIFLFLILCATLQFILNPMARWGSPFEQKDAGRAVFFRSIFLSAFAAFYLIFSLFFAALWIKTLALAIASLLFIYLGISLSDLVSKSDYKWLNHLLKVFFILVALLCILLACLGYLEMAKYILKNACLTIWVSLFFRVIFYLINLGFQKISSQNRLHETFSSRFQKNFIEFTFIKLVFNILMTCILIWIYLLIWQAPPIFIDRLNAFFFKGATFSKYNLSPFKILLALIIFSLINLAGRGLSTKIARHYHSAAQEEQVAISVIVFYLGFFLAVIFAFVTAGIDFTGLAIVAGALSVGVGMGLQGIVNNFVCGLILLLEKQIKVGDRINVNGTEGVIKRIKVRSTQLTTSAKEDVIIPNSELINNKVINYMFGDLLGRVNCVINVDSNSLPENVKKVLLEVASQHPEVLKESPNEPLVLFQAIGEGSYQFTLLCIINDVNRKGRVASDLNFAIEKAFKEKNIQFSFPSYDIRLQNVKGEFVEES